MASRCSRPCGCAMARSSSSGPTSRSSGSRPRMRWRRSRPSWRVRWGPVPTVNPAFAMLCRKLRSWPRPAKRCCSPVRPAWARRSTRAPSTRRADAAGRSSPSIAPRSRASWSRASSTATRGAPTRRRRWPSLDSSRRPKGGRCFSTRSGRWRPSCRPSCCGSRRTVCWRRSAGCARGGSRPASSPRPAARRRRRSPAGRGCASIWRRGSAPSRLPFPPLRERIDDLGALASI